MFIKLVAKVANQWNRLPAEVVFESRLDTTLMEHEWKCNRCKLYKCENVVFNYQQTELHD